MTARNILDRREIERSTSDGEQTRAREIEVDLTRSLAIIRSAWPRLHRPPRAVGSSRNPPASRPPMRTDALSLIAEISRDLAFWVQALIQDDTDGDPHGLSLDDSMGCARYLAGRVGFIAEWTYGNRLATEMHDHARAARGIAWPRPPSILLGECTNRVSVDGTVVQCGTQVRAHMETPGRVTCRGCGKSDTIDGWMLAIVADQRPVTLPQLVPLLHKRLGIVISARTLQRMYRAGQLCAPIGGTRDAPTFDRRDVYAVVISHTAREKGA